MVEYWPGAIAAIQLPDAITLLRFDRQSWRIRGAATASVGTWDGYSGVFTPDVYYDSSYDPSYRPGAAVGLNVPAELAKIHIEFTVSSTAVFYDPRIWSLPNGDFSHDGYWQTPGTVGVGGDPLKGAIEVSWDGAEPRIRYRRDKGAWIVSDLTQMRSSWVWEYFAAPDGEWRRLSFFSKPLNNPATQYPTEAAYAGVPDTPPGPPYTTGGWTIDNVYIFPAEPAPKPVSELADFWTNLINCRELDTGTGSGSGGGVAPGTGGGDSPGGAIVIAGAPYSATLGQISKSAVLWFKVTLAAGTYRFHTTDSPQSMDHDTHLALFNTSGAVVAANDDIDLDGGDYRSSITETLAAGTYYVALSSYGSTAGAGFSLVLAGEYDVPAGTIFKVEAV